MKHFYLLLAAIFFSIQFHAQNAPFITTWEVKPGYLSINIPTKGTGYNYTVDFGDGTILTNQTGNAFHTYSAPGIYTISITGSFPRIYFSGSYYRNYILSIEQWGDVQWQSMERAYNACSNLVINATDAPDLSQVTDMSMMFMNASSINQSINHWDVSNVTDMQSLFQNASAFDQPLSNWDVSNVVNMSGMFQGAINFNQPLDNWDVSSVINMERLFKQASSFNQPLNSWDVSNVTSLGSPINVTGGMFEGATSFNQPLDNWDVSNVIYMSRTFKDATSFNQPIDNWDVSSVTSMNYMFNNATSFNKSLNNWDTSVVTDMSYMFNGASTFNQPLNNWNTSTVQTLHSMFENAIAFNQPINNWNVSNVSQLTHMFAEASSFNQPLNSWVFTNASTVRMFNNAVSFNQPLDNWDGQMNVNYQMFFGASSFNQDLSGWTFPSFVNLNNFVSNSGLDISNYEALLARFDQLGLQNRTLGAHGLLYCNDISRNELINNKGWTIQGDATYIYCNDIDSFISQWEVTLNDLTITIPTTGAGYDYEIKFGDGNVQSNVTGNVTHTYSQPGIYTIMISGDFPRIYFNNSGDKDKIKKILQWGAIEWQSMENAFSGCTSLVIDAIDTPDLSLVTDMSSMFANAALFKSPLNHWDVSNTTNMSSMFNGATSFNQPLHKWDVSNVTDMTNMFNEATFFNKDISNWNFNTSVILSGFLSDCGIDVPNYDALLARFEQLGLQNKTLNANALLYCNTISRDELILNLNWSILGDSLYSHCSDLNAFITTWEFPANDLSITIHTTNPQSPQTFNYTVDFGDGTVISKATSDITHTYSQSGIYTISITGVFPRVKFSDNRILSVEQWGNIQWKSMANSFSFSPNLVINAVDAPDLSQATAMDAMFRGASSFNQDINHWDVSNITNMSFMFDQASSFNQPLNNWDVSNAIGMGNMFSGATSFNQPLDNWDVSNVVNFSDMFSDAVYFNQDLSSWEFKTNAYFDNIAFEGGFVFNSGLDAGNYTALLSRLASLGLQNKALFARGMLYCDPSVRNTLINTLNWNIIEDKHLVDCNPVLSPNAFVTIWDASTFPRTIAIPTTGGGYNYNIDFGDGTILSNVTGSISHTYLQSGAYHVSITGNFPRIYFNDTGDKSKILEIVQWGNIQWQSMEKAFSGCNKLRVYATDTPDLSQVTNMSYMFENASKFNQHINHWDVSNITNMKGLFFGAILFNMPLNSWNVSNVTDMSEMFAVAESFNKPLDNWDVSNVTDMSFMFSMVFNNRSSFNQNLNSWDVSSVIHMKGMFARANHFNHPLNNWDVSSVTDMKGMFLNVRNFNHHLNNWDVSNVTDMSEMFAGAWAFNQPLNNWDVSNVTNMFGMFNDARVFNQHLNNWDISNVTKTYSMFKEAKAFNQPINNWDMSSVTNMGGMFEEAIAFNQPLNNWDVSNVTSMYRVFEEAIAFNQPLNNWDVSKVINMSNMFNNAAIFNQDISDWTFNQSVNFHSTIPTVTRFLSGSAMDITNYDALLARFVQLGLQNKKLGATGLNYCDITSRDQLINNLGWSINGDNHYPHCNLFSSSAFTTTWQVSMSGKSTTSSDNMSITIPTTGSGYDYVIDFGDGTVVAGVTGDVTHTYSQPGIYTVRIDGDFPRIFFNNTGDKDKILSVEQWGNIAWTSMTGAFQGCENLIIHATDSPNLSQMTDMSYMFYEAASFNSPINDWDVSGVTNMAGMFENATSFNQPLDNWDVSSVNEMNNMFKGASLFNSPINDWDVSGVTNMAGMFENATSFNQSLDNWNVSAVTNMNNMFNGAAAFNQGISVWNFHTDDSLEGFLSNSGLDTDHYDALLAHFAGSTLLNKTLGAEGLIFCEESDRSQLINNMGWTIQGDEQLETCSLSIADNQFENIVIYPVPANDILYINIPQGVIVDKISLYNLQGQNIQDFKGDYLEIPVNQLASGGYFLKFHSGNKNHIIQFVKK